MIAPLHLSPLITYSLLAWAALILAGVVWLWWLERRR